MSGPTTDQGIPGSNPGRVVFFVCSISSLHSKAVLKYFTYTCIIRGVTNMPHPLTVAGLWPSGTVAVASPQTAVPD